MRKAGIREVRQNLSALLEEVQRGREVLITDRGRPVARLVPASRLSPRPFPNLAAFRRAMPVVDPPVSQAIIDEREESPY
jgi:prevent-host-death family protein